MAPRARPRFLSLLLIALLVGCSAPAASTSPPPGPSSDAPDASASAAAFPLTITDDAGREVRLDAAPERIVSLAPSSTEIVCALEACDRLVGVTDFDDHPPEVRDVADVVIQAQVDVEGVVAAEPDLVLAAGNEITPSSVIAQLEELGLTVAVLYPESLDEVYGDIELVGEVLDAAPAAEELIAAMRQRVDAVVAAVDGAERPRALYEVFYSEGATYTAGEGSFLASLLDLAGADPITGDAQGLLGAEELVEADPQVILLGTASYDTSLADADEALEAVASRAGWADLSAVRDGRVVPYLDDIVTTRPGPRVVEGLEALARAIHPDRFD